ncbi:MAG TPA: hypothetical protein VE989_04190 [Sphingomicrobium sp.]|nr:hypothetical protein [Sphingomicrobium sp.]
MTMMRQLRTLLVLGAMCWVAPLGAEPSADAARSDEPSGCPYARAAAEAEAAQSGPIVIEADVPVYEHRGPASVFLP